MCIRDRTKIDDEFSVKVADFGLSRSFFAVVFDSQDVRSKEDGIYKPSKSKIPIKWSAPETLHENICTTKSDVWSFGKI